MTKQGEPRPLWDAGGADAHALQEHVHVQQEGETSDAVPDEWLAPFGEQGVKVDEYNARLRADAELLAVLQFSSFTGPLWEELATILAEYGYQVVRAWITSGHIYALCVERRISVSAMRDELRPEPSPADVDDLTQETVSSAIQAFRDKVLIPGAWSPTKGATLKTYFIGQALFRFGDVFRSWALAAKRNAKLITKVTDEFSSSSGDVTEGVEDRQYIEQLLRGEDETMVAICKLAAQGYEQAEIAELLDLSARAVEGRLYRYRRRLEQRHDVA